MTRTFNTTVQCACGRRISMETPWEYWFRRHPQLSSDKGFVRYDLDTFVHRYLTPTDKKGSREIQCVMFVEVKTNGADVDKFQRDSLSMLNQALRNRRKNIHSAKKGRHLRNHTPLAVAYSLLLEKDVRLWMRGGHLLQLEGNCPESSKWMKWDYKPIGIESLLKLLCFDLDPDTLRETDWRRRYSDFKGEATLFSHLEKL